MSEAKFFDKITTAANTWAEKLRANPLQKNGLRVLADLYYLQGRLNDAVPFFKTARYAAGTDLSYQLLLGQLYWRLENTAEALRELEPFESAWRQVDKITSDNFYLLDGAAWLAEAWRWERGGLPRAHALGKTLAAQYASDPALAARLFFPLAGLLRQTGEWALADGLRRAAILRPELADRRMINRQATGLLPDGGDEEGLLYLMDVSRGLRLNDVPRPPLPVTEKIHIGLVCHNVYQHPVGQYLRPLLQAAVAGQMPQLVFYLYNTGIAPETDPVYGELRANAGPHYRDWRGKNLAALRAEIDRDHISILIDLGGRSPGSQSHLFETRLAPIQMLWLGWGHTPGSAGMDYVIADPHCAPTNTRFMHEDLLIIDAPYMQIPKLPIAPVDTTAPVIKNGYVTFGWPNRLDKITMPCFDQAAEILRQLPRSKLLVLRPECAHDFIRDNILAEFRKRDIDAARIEFFANTPDDFGTQLRRIDIVLDPIAVNGGATSMDALAHGVPVVTQPGTQLYQRFTRSFLQYAGMPECVFDQPGDFIAGVVALARDHARLVALRQRLQQKLPQSALLDRALLGRGWNEAMQTVLANMKKIHIR